MKKLFLFCALVTVLTSCQKDIINTNASSTGAEKVMQTPSKESMDLKKNGDPSLTFETLNAKVKVENGILAFETNEDLAKTCTFLQNATPTEVTKWEKSLIGFQSIFRNFFNAKEELMVTDNIELVKSKYYGKVKFDSENSIQPLYRIGRTFGSFINEAGMYRVGEILIAFDDSNDKHFSILDGSLETLKLAKQTLQTDTSKGIYIHDLHMPEIREANSQVSLRTFCSNTCPAFHDLTIKSKSNNFRLRNHYEYIDLTFGGGREVIAIADFNIQVDHETKKWYGWVGDRSGFTWGFGWGAKITSQLGTKGVSSGGQFPIIGISQGGWTWSTSQAYLNVDIFLINNESWTIANGMSQQDIIATGRSDLRLKNCLGRTGIVSKSNLQGDNHVDNDTQFCWSDHNL